MCRRQLDTQTPLNNRPNCDNPVQYPEIVASKDEGCLMGVFCPTKQWALNTIEVAVLEHRTNCGHGTGVRFLRCTPGCTGLRAVIKASHDRVSPLQVPLSCLRVVAAG